jgi:hypothetical protein
MIIAHANMQPIASSILVLKHTYDHASNEYNTHITNIIVAIIANMVKISINMDASPLVV